MATTNKATHRWGDSAGIRARRLVTITGPVSYSTGGDALAAVEVSLSEVEHFPDCVALNASNAAPRLVKYDRTNRKLMWFVPNTAAEVSGATDLSGYSFVVEVIGKG